MVHVTHTSRSSLEVSEWSAERADKRVHCQRAHSAHMRAECVTSRANVVSIVTTDTALAQCTGGRCDERGSSKDAAVVTDTADTVVVQWG